MQFSLYVILSFRPIDVACEVPNISSFKIWITLRIKQIVLKRIVQGLFTDLIDF